MDGGAVTRKLASKAWRSLTGCTVVIGRAMCVAPPRRIRLHAGCEVQSECCDCEVCGSVGRCR